jgi:hypothetical protein
MRLPSSVDILRHLSYVLQAVEIVSEPEQQGLTTLRE